MRRLKPKGFIESSTLGVAQGGSGGMGGWVGAGMSGYKGVVCV